MVNTSLFHAFLAGALILPSLAAAKTDSLRLDPVPLDVRVDCDRVFFKGSQRQPGTVYVMPRVIVGRDQAHEVFQFDPDGQGGFIFSLGVYFPRDDERIQELFKNDRTIPSACNFEEVQYDLNRRAPPGAAPIRAIARMPLTSIELAIPGLSKPAPVGKATRAGEEPDVMNYYGNGYTAEFRLTETEKDVLLKRLARPQGLALDVTFRFQARSSEGSVSAEVDFSALAANLKVAAAGKPNLIGKAEFRSLLQTAMRTSQISISNEAGSSATQSKVFDKILDLVLSENPDFVKSEGGEEKPSLELVKLDGAIELLSKKAKQTIFIEETAAPELATATASVSLESRVFDPNVREVSAVSGAEDVTLPDDVHAGQTFRITAAYGYASTYEIKEKTSFLSASQLDGLQLSQKFPALGNGQMKVENHELNGHLIAVGKRNLLPATAVVGLYPGTRYLWLRTQRYTERVDGATERLRSTIEGLRSLPVYVTFSGLGRRLYQLAELLEPSPDWEAEFTSSGSIVFTAKRDLGLVSIRENFKEGVDYEMKDLVLDEVVQIGRGFFGSETRSESSVLRRETRVPIKIKTLVFYVTRPSSERRTL